MMGDRVDRWCSRCGRYLASNSSKNRNELESVGLCGMCAREVDEEEKYEALTEELHG